jgi:hypothetical protein
MAADALYLWLYRRVRPSSESGTAADSALALMVPCVRCVVAQRRHARPGDGWLQRPSTLLKPALVRHPPRLTAIARRVSTSPLLHSPTHRRCAFNSRTNAHSHISQCSHGAAPAPSSQCTLPRRCSCTVTVLQVGLRLAHEPVARGVHDAARPESQRVQRVYVVTAHTVPALSTLHSCTLLIYASHGGVCSLCRVWHRYVVSRDYWEAHLPDLILAVMCDSDCGAARQVHAAFLRAYGRTYAQTPLVHYDGRGFRAI